MSDSIKGHATTVALRILVSVGLDFGCLDTESLTHPVVTLNNTMRNVF